MFICWQATNKRGKETFYTAAKFILATGERPRYLGIPGDREYCITRWGYSAISLIGWHAVHWTLQPELIFRLECVFSKCSKRHIWPVWSLITQTCPLMVWTLVLSFTGSIALGHSWISQLSKWYTALSSGVAGYYAALATYKSSHAAYLVPQILKPKVVVWHETQPHPGHFCVDNI